MKVCSKLNLIASSDSARSLATIGSEMSEFGCAAEVCRPSLADHLTFMSSPVRRFGPGDGKVVAERCLDKGLIVVGPRLVIVGDGGLYRTGEQGQQLLQPPTGAQPQFAAG